MHCVRAATVTGCFVNCVHLFPSHLLLLTEGQTSAVLVTLGDMEKLFMSLSAFIKLNYCLLPLVQVNPPSLMRPGSVEQYKRAFARQRARDLAQHADTLLLKDKEIAALQQECRELEAQLGTTKV